MRNIGAELRMFYFVSGLIMGSKGRLAIARNSELDLSRDWRLIQHLLISFLLTCEHESDGDVNPHKLREMMRLMDGSGAEIKLKTIFTRSRKIEKILGFPVYQMVIPRNGRKLEGHYEKAQLRMTEEGREWVRGLVNNLLKDLIVSNLDLGLSLLPELREVNHEKSKSRKDNSPEELTLLGKTEGDKSEEEAHRGSMLQSIPLPPSWTRDYHGKPLRRRASRSMGSNDSTV